MEPQKRQCLIGPQLCWAAFVPMANSRCECFPGICGPREAEALGIREALSWIKRLQLPCVIVEMDSLQVFQALTDNFSNLNGFCLIIEECRALVMSIGEVQF